MPSAFASQTDPDSNDPGGASHTRGRARTTRHESSALFSWRLAAAGVFSTTLYLALILPTVPRGPIIGTGQDEWYNVIRALRALYERFGPSYFIHPALYYELLALLYGLKWLCLFVLGALGGGFLDYFLAHENQFIDLARWASVGCGALAVVAAVWLGSEIAGVGAGLLSGLLVASLPLLQTMAIAIRVDALALATFLAAAALCVRWYRSDAQSTRLPAVGIGVAAAANYPGALLLLLLGWFALQRAGTGDRLAYRRRFAVACALAFSVFLALNPYIIIDLPTFVSWFAFQASVSTATHPFAPPPTDTRYLELLRDQGLPAVLTCVIGAAASLTPRAASGALGAFGVAYFVSFSASRSQYDRFVLPAIALLSVAGAAWICTALVGHAGQRTRAAFVTAAAALLVWSALAHRSPAIPPAANLNDYRAEMFDWVEEHVPPTATLVIESDTLPLLQTVYDSDAPSSRFRTSLQEAFARVHPRLPKKVIKTQFIAAVYNYDPRLLDDANVFFLGSSQNREYIAANRAALPGPAAFYDALNERAVVAHETGGVHERLILYAMKRE